MVPLFHVVSKHIYTHLQRKPLISNGHSGKDVMFGKKGIHRVWFTHRVDFCIIHKENLSFLVLGHLLTLFRHPTLLAILLRTSNQNKRPISGEINRGLSIIISLYTIIHWLPPHSGLISLPFLNKHSTWLSDLKVMSILSFVTTYRDDLCVAC